MNRLSLPIVVTPPPFTVPRFIVVNSRNTFRSPISSRVGSPLYLRSCGASPMDANWKILLSSPMVVGPLMTACGPIQVPLPICTPSSMTVYGPTVTPSASSAFGETMALESIAMGSSSRRRRFGRSLVGLGRYHHLGGRDFLVAHVGD